MTQHLHVCAICCRPETDSDVISGLAVDNVGMDIPLNLVILGQTVFEILEELISCRTNEHKMAYSNSAKRDRVSPKNYNGCLKTIFACVLKLPCALLLDKVVRI